jgi:chorismate synthase
MGKFTMAGNSTGYLFRLTTFGESHGLAIGGVIDGCPAGLTVEPDFITSELDRRKPVYAGSTGRQEPDIVEFISGISHGKTTGAPIAFLVQNTKAFPPDYHNIENIYRPSHADYTYDRKYGIPFSAGGGRASGRETIARVVAGSVAKLFLKEYGIEIYAVVTSVGALNSADEPEFEAKMMELIERTAAAGDTLGGSISCTIKGVPPGIGEPVFDKLQANLAGAMLSIGSAKAFEYGLGFQASSLKGSEYNDQMTANDGMISFLTNHDGGIQGGISNGEDIFFRVGFKPVPSVKLTQNSVNRLGEKVEFAISGRHDCCHVPRIAVVVESMAALVIADHLLMNRASRL